jgi:hypothetical protein
VTDEDKLELIEWAMRRISVSDEYCLDEQRTPPWIFAMQAREFLGEDTRAELSSKNFGIKIPIVREFWEWRESTGRGGSGCSGWIRLCLSCGHSGPNPDDPDAPCEGCGATRNACSIGDFVYGFDAREESLSPCCHCGGEVFQCQPRYYKFSYHDTPVMRNLHAGCHEKITDLLDGADAGWLLDEFEPVEMPVIVQGLACDTAMTS